ncbi:MAG: hypothetical protein IKZ19_04005, partial [Clostridia bacterium]|nr:hypothetical protein [Clostridia bacterium]
MNKTAELFYSINEPFGAGFFEEPDASPARRICRAYRRFYESCPVNPYEKDAPLYPTDGFIRNPELAIKPQYCRQFEADWGALEAKDSKAAEIYRTFEEEHAYFAPAEGREDVMKYTAYIDAWNHSALNLKRICAEGVDAYEARIRKMENADLREALLDVIEGIRNYHARSIDYLKSENAPQKLINALEQVPFRPARNAYEAIVSSNFMFCFDGCDDIGHIDAWLFKYWNGEDLTRELHIMMRNLQISGGWSVSVGPEYNEITYQLIKASEGLARPMVELRTTKEMPEDLWKLSLERVLSGGGQPAFYNEDAIQTRLASRIPHAPKEDLIEFCGMGCTEAALTGMTYCGGIDSNLNVLKVFLESLELDLDTASDFDEFYAAFTARLRQAQDNLMSYVNGYFNKRAEICFAPIRSIFTEDCIEREKGFYQGGARYCYAIPDDSGIPNTVDSLMTVKKLVFEDKVYTPDEFRYFLDTGEREFLALCRACPSYGNGNEEADSLMRDLTGNFYAYYKTGKLDLGIGFLPTSHQFTRHICEGDTTPNTPDGRKLGQPVSDSIAAVNGKAFNGPTHMLLSASSFVQKDIYAIPVLNLSISQMFDPEVLRALIEGYFHLGGTQIQITCTSKEELEDARIHPEDHGEMIVRVGGYSDFFKNLSK